MYKIFSQYEYASTNDSVSRDIFLYKIFSQYEYASTNDSISRGYIPVQDIQSVQIFLYK